MSGFRWTTRREKAALSLAQGHTEMEAAEEAKVNDRTIRRWKKNLDFALEVDRLTLMTGVSQKAERLRIAMRVVRQKMQDGRVKTGRDMLEWMKFIQSETDGAKLDLSPIFEAMEAATDSGGNEQE